MIRVILCFAFTQAIAPLLLAQGGDERPASTIRSTLTRMPASQFRGSIESHFVDPFLTSRQIERIQEFLGQPTVFQWDGETTILQIQQDLARHLPVELDVRSLEEIGLTSAEIPLPGERRAITAEQAKGHATDPFGKPVPDNGVDPFGGANAVSGREADNQPEAKVDNEPAVATPRSLSAPRPNLRWWASSSAEKTDEIVVTNGAKLFQYLDSVELTLHFEKGLLKITTVERAEWNGCLRVYDVTPLVDSRNRNALATERRFGQDPEQAESDSLIELIETSVEPDTWEMMGGPSTIASYTTANRRWLVVNASLPTHWKIDALLNRLNQ